MNEIVTPTFEPQLARDRIAQHFPGLKLHELVSVEKVFPTTVLPDLEAAIGKTLPADAGGLEFAAFGGLHEFETVTFSFLVTERREPAVVASARYMDIDIGDGAPGRCIITGMWFFHANGGPAALLVSQVSRHTGMPGARVEVIASPRAGGRDAAQAILAALAKGLLDSSVYKGRAVSFETMRSYHGGLGSLKVHRFPMMSIDQVILPQRTLDTLQRTVFGFVNTRKALLEHGFSAKRGLLLYGPPGTGKTHFIRYLISQLQGHTCLIVAAEQVAVFDEIMAIARALQPSIVVIEDADLLARARETRNDCSQVLLNSLLNHMDGLTDDAEILFVLTTNRPGTLEPAVRDRPGRIDQAIEIPKPDAECRARLLDLYKGRMTIPPSVVAECVRRTENVSAAFIRELARRMAQFAILRGAAAIDQDDMRLAFEEMLGAGSFTAKALGAEELVDAE